MAEARPRQLFNIAPNRPFADDLAAGLLQRFGDPLQLARLLLLLPTRRSIRALTEAFLRESDGAALLLPRMVAVGDLDLDEADAITGGPLFDQLTGAAEAQPAISPLARRLALAKILASSDDPSAAEALALADRLALALDTLEIEGRQAADVAAAVPEGLLQQHWLHNAAVLQVVLQHWPAILQGRGVMDATRRRNLQLAELAQRWQASPPATPVIMAGFAAAPPAVQRLAAAVVRLPQGALVMPGLDLSLSEEALACLRPGEGKAGLETHPQYGMLRILDVAGLALREAIDWPVQSARPGSPPARAQLVADALRPAEICGEFRPLPDASEYSGVRMLEAASPAEEALVIALAMRQLVEHKGRTAALVTPDRALARRVRVQLQRFDISIDDSAGVPLAATGPGSLLIALAVAAGEAFAPVALLSVLQHPLVRNGEARLRWLGQLRVLDRHALRGVRPPPGLEGIAHRLQAGKAPVELQHWWQQEVAPLLAPLQPLPVNAEALLDALREVAEALAGMEFWAGDSGRALAAIFDSAEDSRADLAAIATGAGDAAAFVRTLLAGSNVRPRHATHPQLHIWGPLEARLQSADVLILGGLNESSWPGEQTPDPFLAPAIRRALQLPGLARRIGLQAHDFAACMGAPEVLLTRSVRAGGAPTVASRFWQRLRAAIGDLPDHGHLLPPRAALLQVARGLQQPQPVSAFARPAPAPPRAARPQRITVTDVAMLKADPFSFYAKRILKLAPLDDRDAEPGAGDRGQVVHSILQKLLDEKLPADARMQQLIDQELGQFGDRPDLAALWRPRVVRMLDWALMQLRADPDWQPIAWEKSGELDLGGVILRGRIDRLDRSGDRLRVVDYKTGVVPAQKEVRGLYQTQLALLAAMAEAGLFAGLRDVPVTDLEYWKLGGGRDPGEVKPALGTRAKADDIRGHIQEARADLQQLVAEYLLGRKPFHAKLSMVFGRRFRDYDHLARVAEWLGR